jgi:DNA-binding transcriptional ArsR family regulator
MADSYVMVSLEEERAKRLAQVIANDTCRRILDHLTSGSQTESQLAAALGLPLSTVHYNLKLLRQARLVRADEFHYSPKGKEVLHYSLENKYIVIAPRSSNGVLDRLKELVPLGVVGLAALYVGFFASRYMRVFASREVAYPSLAAQDAPVGGVAPAAQGVVRDGGGLRAAEAANASVLSEGANAAADASGAMGGALDATGDAASSGGQELVRLVVSHPTPHWAWFVAGAACVAALVALVWWWRRR